MKINDPRAVDFVESTGPSFIEEEPAPEPLEDFFARHAPTAQRLQDMGLCAELGTVQAYELALGDAARTEIARWASQPSLVANTEEALNRKWQDRYEEEVRAAVASDKHELITRFRGLSAELLEAATEAAAHLAGFTSAAGARHLLMQASIALRDFLDAQSPTPES